MNDHYVLHYESILVDTKIKSIVTLLFSVTHMWDWEFLEI